MRRILPRRGLAICLLGTVAGLAASAVRVLPATSLCSAATYPHQVALVVELGDGESVGRCVGFNASSISGDEVLRASGLEYATQGYGSLGQAVCQVDEEPAAYSTCLPSSGSYWALFTARGGGAWQPADVGISSVELASGDAEGLRYDPETGPDPAPPSPAGVCAATGSSAPASGDVVPASPGAAGAGISPALLVAAVVLGVLAGLALVQLLLRRRRA
ncbi:MAG: hypothetical protein ABSE52_00265 [Candidatus Dormibacteria bacterium]